MLSFGNTLCAAQISARPKSSFPFYEKLYTYVSPRVSGTDRTALGKTNVLLIVLMLLKTQNLSARALVNFSLEIHLLF